MSETQSTADQCCCFGSCERNQACISNNYFNCSKQQELSDAKDDENVAVVHSTSLLPTPSLLAKMIGHSSAYELSHFCTHVLWLWLKYSVTKYMQMLVVMVANSNAEEGGYSKRAEKIYCSDTLLLERC